MLKQISTTYGAVAEVLAKARVFRMLKSLCQQALS